ncbi:MAG: AMP-dependent synthetase, partial [Pelagimonas sp.]|nr:AMP-dependent synthetase [Pelagimonas sp.]
MLKRDQSWAQLTDGFKWDLPPQLNMAAQACDDWVKSDPTRTAIIDLTAGARRDIDFATLQALSAQVQAALVARGVGAGDRVGVLLSQSVLCA